MEFWPARPLRYRQKLESSAGPLQPRLNARYRAGQKQSRLESFGRGILILVEKHVTITKHIDNTTRIPASHLKASPPAPRSVKIEISPRCNYRCGFCALRTREVQPKWDMDFTLFQRITREMRDAGVEELGMFYLGESFMNPRLLVDCIKYAKKTLKFPYIFLTSNASMAFPEAVEECMEAGLDSLKWSVNAARSE